MSDLVTSVWKGARSILGVVAPTLATALGGPLAGQAAQFVTQALGLAPDAPPDEVTAALQRASPEQLALLKKQDQEFAAVMKKLDIEVDKLANEDRADARQREVETQDWMPKALATLAVVIAAVTAWITLTGYVKVQGEFAASIVVMMLTPFTQVYAYYFGSSFGSKQKTDALGRVITR